MDITRLHTQGTMLYGGDYNPEQWPREVWAEDMRLLREAHINEVTLNVFSWARLQPSEDEYDFSRLDDIVDMVSKAGMSIEMATSTAALPAWMSLRHPDVNRVDMAGRRMRHRTRHNACVNSPTFRKYSVALAAKLAERYASLDNLVAWHVSNEYGGMCWCDTCAEAFRGWLKERYGSIEAVNQAWNTDFWGHTYYDFDEIFPPNELGDWEPRPGKGTLPAYTIDYQRFYGACVLDSFNEEKAAIRRFDAVNPITTNMMGTFRNYDYFDWRAGASDQGRGGVDVVSWDSYPQEDTAASVAFTHGLMRAVGGGKPFILMEQTPTRVNWRDVNMVKRPGQMRQQSWQAVACGADAIQFFQMRQCRSGFEKFHGAVIGADSTDQTRGFEETRQLGQELECVSGRILGSQVEHAKVALIYDWQSEWGIEYSVGPTKHLNYIHEAFRWFSAFHDRHIPVDVVAPGDDLSSYSLVLAPCLYMMPEAVVTNLRGYVEQGGRLLLTPMSAMADEHDSLWQGPAPAPLRDLAGVWVKETDALSPDRQVPLSFPAVQTGCGEAPASGSILFDVLQTDPDTLVIATYDGEFYAGTPAFTFHPSVGQGGVFYVATIPNDTAMRGVVGELMADIEIPSDVTAPESVEILRRVADDGTVFVFVINPTDRGAEATVNVKGTDILTDRAYRPADTMKLGPYGVAVLATDATVLA